MRQKREIRRRAAAYPRTFDFNRIIGVDSGGHIGCHGSNWQTVWYVPLLEENLWLTIIICRLLRVLKPADFMLQY